MTRGAIPDVAIGLAPLYLLLGMIASALRDRALDVTRQGLVDQRQLPPAPG